MQNLKITSKEGTIYAFGNIQDLRVFGLSQVQKIISSDLQDTIIFDYTTYTNDLPVEYPQHSLEYGPECKWVPDNLACGGKKKTTENGIEDHYGFTTSSVPSTVLSNISCRTTTVKFYYNGTNLDQKKKNLLSKIEIRSKASGRLIRVVYFGHTSFGSLVEKNLRLRLDNVRIQGADSTAEEKYSFEYNSNVLPPYYDCAINPRNCNEDYWGFYNGSSSTMIPAEYLQETNGIRSSFGGNRNPNPDFMNACNIKKLYYPTGGRTEFYFSPNRSLAAQITDYNGGLILGGLRIDSIKNYASSTSAPTIKSYEYGDATFRQITSNLFTYEQPYFYFFHNMGCAYETDETIRVCAFGSSICPLTVSGSSPALYTHITEYMGTLKNNSGKTEYTYEIPNVFENYVEDRDPRFKDQYHYDWGIHTPRLITKVDYKKTNNSFAIEKWLSNSYQYYKSNTFQTGYKICQNKTYVLYTDYSENESAIDPYYRNYFTYLDTKAYEDVPLLKQTTVYDYDTDDNSKFITTTNTYEYNNLIHLQPTSLITTNSKNETLTTEYKYPHDFISVAPYNTMVARNNINPIIEQTEKNGTTVSQAFITDYSNNWDNQNNIAPKSVRFKLGTSDYDTLQTFHSYDFKGNLSSLSKANKIRTSYVWSYNVSLPVIKAENVTSANLNSALNAVGVANVETFWSGFNDINSNNTQQVNWKNFNNALRQNALLSGAQITTYTYLPLVGMTSETDPNGKTTYYEYDSFGRLKLIKDNDGKVMKKFDYHYATTNQ